MPKGIPTKGKRKPGAGRKSGPETTTVSFRIPVIFEARLKLAVRNLLNEMRKEQ